MATLYHSTGAETHKVGEVDLADAEAELLKRGFIRAGKSPASGFTYIRGGRLPKLALPVTKWPEYVLLQVYESEPKTKLFDKSGFYFLRELKGAGFLLKPR